MKRPYPGMSPLTTAMTTYLDNLGRTPIERATRADIERSRAKVYPTSAPFSWITGPVAKGVAIREAPVTGADGAPLAARWYHPPGPDRSARPLLVFFHGGGWVQGSTRMYDPLCSHLAAEVDAVVVSIDYRMAPEHTAPTAARDAIEATRWLSEQVDRAYDPRQIGLCGDSAGGNLSAVVAQQLRDLAVEGTPVIRHQALLYPATDLTLASPSIREHANAPILTEIAIHTFRRHYLGEPAVVPEDDPLVSPLFGNVAGVAPAVVQTADLDPIRDDGLRYTRLLQDHGVPVRTTNYAGVPHGFASFPGVTPTGRQHRRELVTEIRHHLHERAGP